MLYRVLLGLAAVTVASGCSTVDNPTGNFPGTDNSGSDWCSEGDRWTSANPRTGESVAFNIQGITSHNGRQVCHAQWRTQNSDGVSRIDYYFTEDSEYVHYLTYNEDGNLVYEMEATDSGGSFRVYDENGTLINEGNYSN